MDLLKEVFRFIVHAHMYTHHRHHHQVWVQWSRQPPGNQLPGSDVCPDLCRPDLPQQRAGPPEQHLHLAGEHVVLPGHQGTDLGPEDRADATDGEQCHAHPHKLGGGPLHTDQGVPPVLPCSLQDAGGDVSVGDCMLCEHQA